MNFGDILDQWERRTQKPYGKKQIKNDERKRKHMLPCQTLENEKQIHPMEKWLRRYGVYDKDAEYQEGDTREERIRQKNKIRAMRAQAQIDLHGMTTAEAYQALTDFFDQAIRKNYKKILIIHGKGNHSQGAPVLSLFVKQFLERHPHAGETGHPKEGNSGSTWVLLK